MAKIESLSELDEYYEQKEFEEKISHFPTKIVAIIIIIIISIVLGIVTYKVTDSLLKKNDGKQDQEFIGESVPLTDENIQILYQYVTLNYDGTRNTKFATTREVSIDSFSNKEKIEYALSYAQVEDFEFTGEVNTKKQKIYTIPTRTIANYMKLYFGPNVSFEPESQLKFPFTFYINKMNEGTMTYNRERDGYDTVFASRFEFNEKKSIEPVYGTLISALKRPDGSIVLQERVVYTTLRTDNGGYAIDIYKDPEKTTKLDTKTGLQDSDLGNVLINASSYQNTAIVEYTFGLNGNTLYFQNSKIII